MQFESVRARLESGRQTSPIANGAVRGFLYGAVTCLGAWGLSLLMFTLDALLHLTVGLWIVFIFITPVAVLAGLPWSWFVLNSFIGEPSGFRENAFRLLALLSCVITNATLIGTIVGTVVRAKRAIRN